jgi:hypothetical protein
MTDTVLLKARCAAGHEWDVWAQEDAESYRCDADDLVCPTCRPPRGAVELGEPENLA